MTILDMRVGVHEEYPPAETAVRFPGAAWTREFVAGPGGTPLSASTTADNLIASVLGKASGAIAAGGGCMVSIKLDLLAVANGAWSTRLIALGRAIVGLKVLVIVNHEPEDDMRASVFVPGFRAARDALKVGNPQLDVAYCAMAYQWRPGSLNTKDAAAWAAVVADLYLVDVYSGKTFSADAILPTHPGWKRWYTEVVVKHPGRRWGIAERGWLAGTTRARTIAREAEWLVTDPIAQTCEVYNVWATGGTEGNPGWLLDAAAESAVESLFARITVPGGYSPTADRQLVVHAASGAVVARDQTDTWAAVYRRLMALSTGSAG